MADKKKSSQSENKSISISGDVKDSTVIVGDHNTVNSDSDTLEHRNRRIFLNTWKIILGV